MGHLFMKRERLNNILIHLVVISIVFVLPEVVSTQPQGCVATAGGIVLCVPYLKVAVLIGVFYLVGDSYRTRVSDYIDSHLPSE